MIEIPPPKQLRCIDHDLFWRRKGLAPDQFYATHAIPC
jgi:hypothetical protein